MIILSVTLKEIANQLGISVSTLSRVINNKGNVNRVTQERVEEALSKANYVPNTIARALKMNNTNIVGIIIPDIRERLFSEIISGIDGELFDYGYSILLADSNESGEKEKFYLDILMQQRVDALVLATTTIYDCRAENYLDAGIPTVFIDSLPHNITKQYDAVLVDNYLAGRIGAQYLLDLGHTDVAVITGINATPAIERLRGFQDTYSNAGAPIPDTLISSGYFKKKDGIECMGELLALRSKNPYTAVVVMFEMMVAGAFEVLREHGLKVPEDISLLGYDVQDKMGLAVPAITTVNQPENKIGKITASLLLDRLKVKRDKGVGQMKQDEGHKILLTPFLHIADSCVKR